MTSKRSTGRRRKEGGAVTAELAMALPLLLGVTVALVWLLALAVGQVRVTDAAREVARGVARGDADADAQSLGRQIAPGGAAISVTRSGDLVSATVEATIAPPGGWWGFGSVTLTATAVAAAEPGSP